MDDLKRSPLNKLGLRARRNLPLDKAWREAVLRRDGYRCVRCGRGEPVEVHHIQPKGSHYELRHVIGNGATLCVDAPGIGGCHYNWAHGNNTVKEAREWLIHTFIVGRHRHKFTRPDS